MRPEPNTKPDQYRVSPKGWESPNGVNYGCFEVHHNGNKMGVISSGSGPECAGWEHVSVSLKDRTPTWEEMCFIKDLFWSESETVVQYHVQSDKHINTHPFCLHMWKCIDKEFPMPEAWMV